MIQITCPNNNIPERTYSIEVMFVDLLGCNRNDLDIRFEESIKDYELVANDKRVVIEDHFFNHFPKEMSYLKPESIPDKTGFFHWLDSEIPIIYGRDFFEDKDNYVTVGLDVFASAFFMLTRWEESVLGREESGDCNESLLLCVKQGVHNRPIVNEYADLLRKLLPGCLPVSPFRYSVVLSHDVDGFLPPTWSKIVKDFVKQTLRGAPKNKVLNLPWQDEVKYKRSFPTPFSQFELYTALTEKYKIPEWFYFKVCGKGEVEATYMYDDKQTADVVKRLKRKKEPRFVLGFHPSQNTYGKKDQWNKEVARITDLLQGKPSIGRNHHLLFNYATLRMWESIADQPLHISNCVFHYRQGFRSGVCIPYPLFDIFQRRVMSLIEHPCQIMDTVIRYNKKARSTDDCWKEIQSIVEQVKHHRGELVLTWHIYIRNKVLISDYYNWCEKTICYAVK